MQVEIEKLVYGGEGLARIGGRIVLAPFVLPGEIVELGPPDEAKQVLRARPGAWLKRSPERREALCPVFTRCGGCSYQHIDYAGQLHYKRQILRETLARTGGVRWEGSIETVSADPWNYRNRTQLRLRRRGGEPAEIGFHAAGSHELVAVDACPINSPKLNEAHRALAEAAREDAALRFPGEIELCTDEERVSIHARKTGRPLGKRFFERCARRIDGLTRDGFLDYKSGGDVFRVECGAFFQVNRFLTGELARRAAADASGGLALDLYCGAGLTTLPLARRFKRAVAVDAHPPATRSLRCNLSRAGLAAQVVNLDVGKFLAAFDETPDLVVADPPRAGLGAAVTRQLLRLRPKRIHLVSCDPATLGRDLKALLAGGCALESLTLIDLFPQTAKLETIAALRRG